ncbi:uncharacterized protein N7459_009515 [Penicillium hispanicum]|uniref:uncharacterized protein n=1 Tax=Penicillium hispanicum TaxID=1080232 RepID=UPI002541FF17|nr:uncharacterized protein N7459_009515 [Penicillium hispanicum]KAJ5570085.1 hypothetical protein N7459_009515 [Penicillium hispanicum]
MSHCRWRSSKAFVILVVCISVFTDIFLYGLIVPVLPFTLATRVGLADADIQRWASILLACYGGSILLGSLIFGWMGDQTKTRQAPFLLGLVILAGATLLFSLTKHLVLIVLARILQGLSTAIVFTVGFSMMLDTVGNEGIGRAVGFTSMSLSLGLFAGPIVGGFLYDSFGYFAVFMPAFVLVGVDICLRLLRSVSRPTLAASDPDEERSPLLPAYNTRNSSNCLASMILVSFPRFVVAMLGMYMLNTFMTAFEAVLPVYLHELFDYTSSQVAVVFLSNTIPMVLSPLSGTVVDKIGPFWPAVAGFSLAAPSMMLLSLVQKNTLVLSLLARLFLFLFGCGVSMAMPAMMAEISMATDSVEKLRPGIFGPQGAYSQAYGLSNAAFAGGTLAGPLYAGFIKDWAGWTAMSVALGGLSLVMVLLVVVFTGGKPQEIAQDIQD